MERPEKAEPAPASPPIFVKPERRKRGKGHATTGDGFMLGELPRRLRRVAEESLVSGEAVGRVFRGRLSLALVCTDRRALVVRLDLSSLARQVNSFPYTHITSVEARRASWPLIGTPWHRLVIGTAGLPSPPASGGAPRDVDAPNVVLLRRRDLPVAHAYLVDVVDRARTDAQTAMARQRRCRDCGRDMPGRVLICPQCGSSQV